MNKRIPRRTFLKTSGSAAVGALLYSGSASFLNSCQTESFGLSRIDWAKMLSSQDLLWKTLPTEMSEAPHFGNGLIGSMIWVENNSIRLQIFRTDVHDHGDHTYGWTAYSRPRYQIGYFTIKPKGEITGCDLRQDLYNARLTGQINTQSGSLKVEHFVHRLDDVIYTSIECTGEEQLADWQWNSYPAKGSRGGSAGSASYGQAYAPYKQITNPDPVMLQQNKLSISLQDMEMGGDYATAWLANRRSRETELLVTIQNSYPDKSSRQTATKLLEAVQQKIASSPKKWRSEHESWWHNYYPESYVSFPDPVGQSFYWNNVYRLACCTRPDAQYIDTPGLWNTGGPWPYSTHDFNTQTAHFPVYTANRLHLGEALVEALRRNQQNLIENVVPEEWQEDSALLNLATAFDMKGKRDGDARYREMLGCLPWLLNNVWMHYRYTMDPEILVDPLFPLLRRSINLYRHILYPDTDGKLHLPPTFSPETGNFSDCNFDLALIRWGCQRLLDICEILKMDDSLIPEWKRILDQLVAYQVDERGFMLGKDRSAPQDHQHMSHLLMIYPLYLENRDTAADFDLLERSVRNFQPPTALPKMAASQSAPAAAALGLGNLAFERMNSILYSERENEKLGLNGIYYLSTPCIETSLSYNTCVQDMLLQSWGGKIRIFPALPDAWKDVEFHDLRTEGAFLVSAKREQGLTRFVKIKSLKGGVVEVDLSMGAGSVHFSLEKDEERIWQSNT